MIGSIRGKIVLKTEKFLIVEAGGVGYKISVSPDTLSRLDALRLHSGQNDTSVSFWIHTHVREDTLDLYGFLNHPELEFFEMLIGISGIGPKSALAILGITSIETLRKAIGTGDTSYLTKISGIGKKTAEKIVIELRDKMGTELGGTSLQGELDSLEALKSLGYSQSEAREALKKVSSELDTNAKIKEALKALGGK
ncbi:Holliday junction branch migration protein RuvA [Candidatus Nomurabacteria bacterium]|nr:Holliday junction branch migration protein RuvA [Candidatus Nomurabacteria bacterium]